MITQSVCIITITLICIGLIVVFYNFTNRVDGATRAGEYVRYLEDVDEAYIYYSAEWTNKFYGLQGRELLYFKWDFSDLSPIFNRDDIVKCKTQITKEEYELNKGVK